PAAPQTDLRVSGNQEPFVDVVVEDGAKLPLVLPAQFDADPLHDGIADGVGVPLPLTLHDLDFVLGHRLAREDLDRNRPHAPPPPGSATCHSAIRARAMGSYDKNNLPHPLNLAAADKDGHKHDPGDHADGQIEDEVAAVSHQVLDVVAEDP